MPHWYRVRVLVFLYHLITFSVCFLSVCNIFTELIYICVAQINILSELYSNSLFPTYNKSQEHLKTCFLEFLSKHICFDKNSRKYAYIIAILLLQCVLFKGRQNRQILYYLWIASYYIICSNTLLEFIFDVHASEYLCNLEDMFSCYW